jgi:hypothetical protein
LSALFAPEKKQEPNKKSQRECSVCKHTMTSANPAPSPHHLDKKKEEETKHTHTLKAKEEKKEKKARKNRKHKEVEEAKKCRKELTRLRSRNVRQHPCERHWHKWRRSKQAQQSHAPSSALRSVTTL